MTTDYTTAKDYDAAMDEARKAAGGSSIDGFVERIAERVGAKASVRAVFGDPIERGEITVIPVARVRWGFGGGAGRGPIAVGPGIDAEGVSTKGGADEGLAGVGTGGGGGATADPIVQPDRHAHAEPRLPARQRGRYGDRSPRDRPLDPPLAPRQGRSRVSARSARSSRRSRPGTFR